VIRHHVSPPMNAAERGHALGVALSEEIARTLGIYRELFAAVAGEPVDLDAHGAEAIVAIAGWAPSLAEEIEGVAAGAKLPLEHVAALNARTEILAGARARGECSVAVALSGAGGIVAAQNWDWHEELAGSWFVHTIEHPDGQVVHTLTEFGILGKIGLSSAGVGVLLNILRQREDREHVGVPVHVVVRRVLDDARDINEALVLIASASTSASSAVTLVAAQDGEQTALTAELGPPGPAYVLPEDGLLLHTNHFLAPTRLSADLEPKLGPDSLFRLEVLRRSLGGASTLEQLMQALASHIGGAGAICCHPANDAPLGGRHATLATITLEPQQLRMTVTEGGPCSPGDSWTGLAHEPTTGGRIT
jgi:isopenicillin-N N-acyltransferase like protein